MVWIMVIVSQVVIFTRVLVDLMAPSAVDDKAQAVAVSIMYSFMICFAELCSRALTAHPIHILSRELHKDFCRGGTPLPIDDF